MDTVITTDEYRKLLDDHTSTDEQITKRIEYLEAFCRNVIMLELEQHVETTHHGKPERRPQNA